MKKIILIICLFLPGIYLCGERVAVMDDLAYPDSLVIDGSTIYISQQAEVFIYDAKTYKFKTKFGKLGQGPQEIPPFPLPMSRVQLMRVTPLPDKLFISAIGKILYYTKEGEYIKEFKYPFPKIQNHVNLFPLGSDLVCQLRVPDKDEFYVAASIVDKTYELKKELKRKKVNLHGGKMDLLSSSIVFEVYKDRIYVTGEGFSIDVFDGSGKLLRQIKHQHEPIKFTTGMRKQFDESMKFMLKDFYEQLKNIFYYPEYLPTIFNIQFSDPYLYVFTWNFQGDKRDLFIFKLDGTFVKKTVVSLKMVQFIIPYPFEIVDKNLFQLVDNEETEEWELHRTSIH